MESEYDRKFQEMKGYLPFLENVIKKLSNTHTTPNPRQAQLDKIRSLRDLLVEKNKKMKMENLYKCEQVLINLYAKMGQTDTLPGIEKAIPPTLPPPSIPKPPDLTSIRNKLKNVTDKFKRQEKETLPEIARASEIEEICTSGSKEPALFQRRPNKQSLSPTPSHRSDSQRSTSKRNYTRVLVSPEREPRWSKSSDRSPEKLFSRRSPHRSPRKSSPSYKKERKKSFSGQSKKKSRDLNITLDVPEESLGSLQTENILPRIIKCDDNDVDIDTLREIRAKLINELKQTGASEDITDLILKSYKKKPKSNTKKVMEEGELSDSESELIDNVYGSLVINKDKGNISDVKASSKKGDKESRKIQISLVYNSINDIPAKPLQSQESDTSDFKMFNETVTGHKDDADESAAAKPPSNKKDFEKSATETYFGKINSPNSTVVKLSETDSQRESKLHTKDLITLAQEQITEIISINDDEDLSKRITEDIQKAVTSACTLQNADDILDGKNSKNQTTYPCIPDMQKSKDDSQRNKETTVFPFKPNFYKPLADSGHEETSIKITKTDLVSNEKVKNSTEKSTVEENSFVQNENKKLNDLNESVTSTGNLKSSQDLKAPDNYTNTSVSGLQDNVNIPFISAEPTKSVEAPDPAPVVSEIDILQALKNEILNETVSITGAEQATPPLHQPKVTKVANVKEITNKKRISIEKYKEKSVSSSKQPSLFVKTPYESTLTEELSKKQSLKLTEKEYERFKLFDKLDLGDSSEEENRPDSPDPKLYANLAPKSPEQKDDTVAECSPIIIPAEPLKETVNKKADVDMRTLLVSPTSPRIVPPNVSASVNVADTLTCLTNVLKGKEKKSEPYIPPPVDPRLRIEDNGVHNERTPRQVMYQNMYSSRQPNMTPSRQPDMTPSRNPNMTPSRNPNMTPSRNPNMTPNRNPNMTPNARTFEMTPSHQSFDFEDSSSRKHVYAPFLTFEPQDRETSISRDVQKPTIDEDQRSPWGNIDTRDRNQRSTSILRDNVTDYQRPRNFNNERYNHREDYSNRQDCPRTPVHPFGRLESPSTPTPSFGRMDTPLTPVPTFGRSDCSSTLTHPFSRSELSQAPNNSYGRNECPRTPIHPFGRADCPTTPSHPFGRSEAPMTPSHSFGRTEYRNSNINQKNIKDPRINRTTDYDSHSSNYNRYQKDRRCTELNERSRDYNRSDSFYNNREQTTLRNDTFEKSGRSFDKGLTVHGECYRRQHDQEHLYRGERNKCQKDYNEQESQRDYRKLTSVKSSKNQDYNRFSRAPSVGRSYKENSLAVTPKTGHSFTIDTSVNRTFQEFLNKKGIQGIDYKPSLTFDTRRQRAASVGRALLPDPPYVERCDTRAPSVVRMTRESSVGRTLTHQRNDNFDCNRRNNYSRARSVGRDIADIRQEKSFKDIKAEFRSYSKSLKIETPKKYRQSEYKSDRRPQNRKECPERSDKSYSKQPQKPTYSPRKNHRDPRMRRELSRDHKNNSFENRHGKHFGIVYSNDNIARGAILGPGYGVKNYKIPKIKRAPEEKPPEVQPDTENFAIVKDKNVSQNEKSSKTGKNIRYSLNTEQNSQAPGKNKKDSNRCEKAIESKKSSRLYSTDDSESLIRQVTTKSKKIKKPIITSDSDTDNETKVKDSIDNRKAANVKHEDKITVIEARKKIEKESVKPKNEKNNMSSPKETEKGKIIEDIVYIQVNEKSNKEINTQENKTEMKETKSKEKNDKNLEEQAELKETDKVQDNLLDSSFGIDDLSMFPDNLESDQVMDNINALIADLDNEIDDSKDKNEFTNDLNIKNIIENIETKTVKDNLTEETLEDIHEIISDLNETGTPNNKVRKNEKDLCNTNNFSENNIVTPSETQTNKIVQLDNVQLSHTEKVTKIVCDNNLDSDLKLLNSVDNVSGKGLADKSNDQTVSTSEISKQGFDSFNDLNQHIEVSNIKSIDRSSTPDSTVNASVQDTTYVESIPDSTNEANPDISSTNIPAESSEKKASDSNTENSQQIDSIGNILSILKDKSKIKELLSMLGDESSQQNEKIKKKLEKLSEIVSDDDEGNDFNETLIEEASKNESLNVSDVKVTDATEKQETNNGEKDDASIQPEPKDMFENRSTKTNVSNVKKDVLQQDSDKVKTPIPRKGPKGKRGKKQSKVKTVEVKRVTRSGTTNVKKQTQKKPSRELQQLQNDIKEMFISDDVLNATGIRMCRLAKFVDAKNLEESMQKNEANPVVVLEKFKENETADVIPSSEKVVKKKLVPKQKTRDLQIKKDSCETKNKVLIKHKPGPKSRTRPHTEEDTTEQDSIDERNTGNRFTSSDSDNDSLDSSKSFGSSEALIEVKKKIKRKRGRGGWQSGVIKKKKKRVEKSQTKQPDSLLDESAIIQTKDIKIPDMNCFIDKSYCFLKNNSVYSCRLCEYSGNEIVHHYKSNHPHSEIPLSRMSPAVAREAIDQCDVVNFQTICKLPTDKYICRFCYKEFASKKKANALEGFFWHVVSTHTGEYKQLCSECVNVTRCPFNLDIPPPPKDIKGQLIGYICGKCNFTQISLENLKTHVIVRHNDEQTAVYTINLAAMNKKSIESALKETESEPRTLRSSRSNQSFAEASDERSDVTDSTEKASDIDSVKDGTVKRAELRGIGSSSKSSLKSVVDFDNDDDNSVKGVVKVENIIEDQIESDISESHAKNISTDDVLDYSHFKINYSDIGNKVYICCINGKDNHYKTSLLISMKKHVQTKHSELWDGYCSICKVIVTPQGKHSFKECFQHLLDKHFDDFPVMDKIVDKDKESEDREENVKTVKVAEIPLKPKPYINVRPLSQLLSKDVTPFATEEVLPKINEVISYGDVNIETVLPKDSIQRTVPAPKVSPSQPLPSNDPLKYEEVQTEVMSQKHQVVLDTMMSYDKLVKIFKCAGKFCYFTSDNLDDSLLHANTHQRIGGDNSLLCSYCDFDCGGNAISLVMHVFKAHGCCPYVCNKCFYRAVSSQLVRAHATRVHGEEFANLPVLKTDVVTPGSDAKDLMISRDVAVQQYQCANVKDVCKFKTYTEGKFCEHLVRHQPPFLCYICSNVFPTPFELVTHMKSHGLKVLQCTWCIYGADNDEEFLAHASTKHPNKLPQGYFRVITSQDSSKVRVLPLVHYNNQIPVEVVTPSAKDNPVREAERALELENLIKLVKETVETSAPEAPVGPSTSDASNATQEPETTITPIPVKEQQPVTPVTSQSMNVDPQLKPVLKAEPVSTPSNSNVSEVILLDSDEEDSMDSRLPTVDLSSDDTSAKGTIERNVEDDAFKKIDINDLYKCSLCSAHYKKIPALKKHMNNHDAEKIKCAHCSLVFSVKSDLFKHYEEDHRFVESSRDLPDRNPKSKAASISGRGQTQIINCSKCSFQHKCRIVKEHLKTFHGCKNSNFVTRLKIDQEGNTKYEMHASDTQKQTHKRKLSMGSDVPTKKKRYGPENVNDLPNKPILDELVFCALCEFNSKVRINVVRHLQGHADKQPVAQTVPVNPVPHLETNEKHFDKMVNLASSSIVTRAPDKPTRVENVPCLRLPPEETLRYPKYVSDRQRHTCGAKGCSYISVDEDMLKCHWETLHGGCHEFHCVHCPPYQQLDTSRPLTAARILVHLRMHDANLYACSSCSYYHYKRDILKKHISEMHKGSGQVVIVREENTSVSVTPSSSAAISSAPTMDLKPWQCGLCKYKNMLRQEVVEHCSKVHNSKMQFKCPNCPFRTSTFENVTKHLSHSHPKSQDEVLYYYYREGSISDESDGTPRWVKQRQKLGIVDSEVKTEVDPPRVTSPISNPTISPAPAVNLDIVKKEVPETEVESSDQLRNKFGPFCDPNGLKYKCPLCKVFNEGNKEVMQEHLFEELKYRKWGCSICSYKAFHKVGLNEHIQAEHARQKNLLSEPVELPVDSKVEKWVAELLSHQTALIENTKKNFTKLQQQMERPCLYQVVNSSSDSSHNQDPVPILPPENTNTEELIQAFGELGTSENLNYCCPKCEYRSNEEEKMRDHLESELNKIRWRCSNCNRKFQDYHEAQLHCRTVHFGQSSRPVEALRDPAKRAAWVTAVLETQKSNMPVKVGEIQQVCTPSLEESLLVVRYEEDVPTPEELMRSNLKKPNDAPALEEIRSYGRKRPPSSQASSSDSDDDDDKLVIDEATDNKNKSHKTCPHCSFTSKYPQAVSDHIYRHFNLKPYTCGYCSFSCYSNYISKHNEMNHSNQKNAFFKTPLPDGPPLVIQLPRWGVRSKREIDKKTPDDLDDSKTIANKTKDSTVMCLICEKSVPESAKSGHVHSNLSVVFAKKGDFVVKCCNCMDLVLNVDELKIHHKSNHSNAKLSYVFYKLNFDKREIHCCAYCNKSFKLLGDLKAHHSVSHKGSGIKYIMRPFNFADVSNNRVDDIIDLAEDAPHKRQSDEPTPQAKRVARKSTTKLPNRTVAKKSTTKLPYTVDGEEESEQEYSYYGTKPTSLDDLENVYTLMPFCNTTMPFSMKKLSEIIKISPSVLVKDMNKC